VLGGRLQDSRDEIHPVLAGAERQSRLVTIFPRQTTHDGLRHIRRIGEDQVVVPTAQAREEIGADQFHAMPQAVQPSVSFGDRKGASRDVDRIDLREWKSSGSENCQASGASAHIEHSAHAPRPAVQQTGNV
jgi:hypothetical protein